MDNGPVRNQMAPPPMEQPPLWGVMENGPYGNMPPPQNNYNDHMGPKPALLPRPDMHTGPSEWMGDWVPGPPPGPGMMMNNWPREVEDDRIMMEERMRDDRIHQDDRMRMDERIPDDRMRDEMDRRDGKNFSNYHEQSFPSKYLIQNSLYRNYTTALLSVDQNPRRRGGRGGGGGGGGGGSRGNRRPLSRGRGNSKRGRNR